jgi:lipoprotein-anchoring transpeptidase ErfK/SrfK
MVVVEEGVLRHVAGTVGQKRNGIPGRRADRQTFRRVQGGTDTLYRIHGTNEPDSIGRNSSSGCIRMRNESAVDLYGRTPIGTKVIVLATRSVGA